MGHISGRGRLLDSHTSWRWDGAVSRWRRRSLHWRTDGALDLAEVFKSWVEAWDHDNAAALGAILLVLDEAGLLDPREPR